MAKKKNPPIDSSTTPEEPKNTKKRTKKSKAESMDDLSLVSNKKEKEEQKVHYCSICGRASNEVQCMVTNSDEDVVICNDCLENMTAIAQARIAQINGDLQAFRKFTDEESEEEGDVLFNSNIPTPHEIKEYLDQYVIGQDDAKITLSVAVYNHYKRIMQKVDENDENAVNIEKNNIIVCGNSGSGKTFLLKTIAKFLNVPICITNCTQLTSAGYVGDDVESIIQRLYLNSGEDVQKTEMGICVIDEFDKLASHVGNGNVARDVNGLDVQQGLLKLLEGTDVYIETGSRHGPSEKIRISSEKILFIAVGRFQALPDVIRKRLNQHQMGFDLSNGKDQDGNEIDSQNVIKYAEPEDFRKCGFIQEIVGRLPVITYVNPLTKEDLKRILLEPKNSIIKQYKKLFELSGKKLIIKDDVYDYIVSKGFKTDSGARGLRNVVENILKQKMFDSPSEPDKEVLIDMDYVKKVESKNFIDPTKKMEIETKKKITL